MRKITFLFALLVAVSMQAMDNLETSIGRLDNGAANGRVGIYTWKGTTSNLLSCFTFSEGELANYTKLCFTYAKKSESIGNVRIGYTTSAGTSSYVNFKNDNGGTYFGSTGTKTINFATNGYNTDLVAANVVGIYFGGNTLSASEATDEIYLYNMYLEDNEGNRLYANFGAAASNATYVDYTWTATTNNLAGLYAFSEGELAKYTTLTFTLSNKSDGAGNVRIGAYVNSDWTPFVNDNGGLYFGSTGTKTIHLFKTDLDLSTVTKICFGGHSGTGSINIRNIYLSNDALNREFTAGQNYTVCLPYALTEEEVSAAGEFYELMAFNETNLGFDQVTTTTAYKPYLFIPSGEGTVTPFASLDKSAASHVGETCTTSVDGVTFKGVLAPISDVYDAETGNTVYGYNAANGEFVKVVKVEESDKVSIDAFRAYIVIPGGASLAPRLKVSLGHKTPTAIEDAQSPVQSTKVFRDGQLFIIRDGRTYNCMGQLVD